MHRTSTQIADTLITILSGLTMTTENQTRSANRSQPVADTRIILFTPNHSPINIAEAQLINERDPEIITHSTDIASVDSFHQDRTKQKKAMRMRTHKYHSTGKSSYIELTSITSQHLSISYYLMMMDGLIAISKRRE